MHSTNCFNTHQMNNHLYAFKCKYNFNNYILLNYFSNFEYKYFKIMRHITLFSVLILSLAFNSSCRKKPLPTNNTTQPTSNVGSIDLQIQNYVGTRALKLNDPTNYTLSNGEELKVKVLAYYLSNFVLTDENGVKHTDSNSYYLVMENDEASKKITLKNVPKGNYTKVDFMIGVDSLHNVSGAQDGYLAPSYGMFWSWSTGYIMAKLEGTSPQSSNINNDIIFHIAGFKGSYNVLQHSSMTFPTKVIVKGGVNPSSIVSVKANIATWFESFTFPGFNTLPTVATEGRNAQNIALSYNGMLSTSNVENK